MNVMALMAVALADDLAARCARQGFDIGRGTISHIETGLRGVSDLEMVLLARALRVKLGRAGARQAAGVAQGPAAADGEGGGWGVSWRLGIGPCGPL